MLPKIKSGPTEYYDFAGPNPERGVLSPDASRPVAQTHARPTREPVGVVEMGIVHDARGVYERTLGEPLARDFTASAARDRARERQDADYQELLRRIGKSPAPVSPAPADFAAAPPPSTPAGPRVAVPAAVQAAARQGLALRGKFGMGGSSHHAKIAQMLAAGEAVSLEIMRLIAGYFRAHADDAVTSARWGDHRRPSPSYIAWLLHGGESGRAWVAKHVGKVDMSRPHDPGSGPVPPLPVSMKADQLARDAAGRPGPDTDRDYETLMRRMDVKDRKGAMAAVITEDARERAREVLAGLYDQELRELQEIETDRLEALETSEVLAAELRAAGGAVQRIRAALSELPGELQRAQLEGDVIREGEIQDRYRRLRDDLEASTARLEGARDAHDRGAVTELQAAQRASGRAYQVKQRADQFKAALTEELDAAIKPVEEGQRAASSLAMTLQTYGP